MPSIHTKIFAGLRPALTDRNLQPERATVAHNTRLRDGAVRGFNGPKPVVGSAANVASIYRTADSADCCAHLIQLDHCASFVESTDPASCDGYEGLVVFHHDGATEPQRYFRCHNTGAGAWYPLVVPQPQLALTAARTTAGVLQNQVMGEDQGRGPDQRAYTYTWVDQFGIESPPAIPSAPYFAYDDEVWTVTGFQPSPAHVVAIRLYRSSGVFEDGQKVANPFDTSFQLVEEIDAPAAYPLTYVDRRRMIDMDYGTMLTDQHCPPPAMDQVVMTEQGYSVGFKANDLYVSERHEPHNWPMRYRQTIPDKIIGLAVQGDFVYIITTGRPYRCNISFVKMGDEADATVDLVPLADNYPGLTRHAFCACPPGAIYASRRGLVFVPRSGPAQLITRGRIDEDEWYSNWCPNVMTWHNGKLFCARWPVGKSFIFDVNDAAEGQLDLGDLVTVDMSARAMHSARNDVLYFANADGVFAWNYDNDALPVRWKSKRYRFPGFATMAAAKVIADYGAPVTFTIWGDDESKPLWTTQVHSREPFRLPRFGRHIEWSYQIDFDGGAVYEVHIASSMTELSEDVGG